MKLSFAPVRCSSSTMSRRASSVAWVAKAMTAMAGRAEQADGDSATSPVESVARFTSADQTT